MRHLMIGIPAHSSQVHAATLSSVVQSVYELAELDTVITLHCWAGDSILPRARNGLVAQFLASDCTDLLCLDADISWGKGELAKLLSHPVDFVAGSYRYKRHEEGYPINWIPKDELWADPDTGLLEVWHVPAGFLRMTRAACEKLAKFYADRAYQDPKYPDLNLIALFEQRFDDGMMPGEDYLFCDRWHATGGKVWIDPHLTLTHHDGAASYTGCIGKWLRSRDDGDPALIAKFLEAAE
jgi:hypothetical protein